ncbi:hypothetical protein ABHN98_14720 [Pseudomonas syringae]
MEERKVERSRDFYLGPDLDYRSMKVGDRLNDELILNIYHVNPRAIVYRNEEIVTWAARGVSISERRLMSRLNFLLERAKDKFKGVNRNRIDRYKVRFFTAVLGGELRDGQQESDSDACYLIDELEQYIDAAEEVVRVVDMTKDFVVWIDKEGEVAYEVRDGKKFDDGIFIELSELSALGRLMLEDSQRKLFVFKLASSLVVALRKNSVGISESFDSAKQYLMKVIEVQASSRLIYSVIAFSLLLLSAFTIVYFKWSIGGFSNLNMFLVGAGGGLLGALISVLQRSKDIKVVPFESLQHIVLQGFVRIGLGCCFGVIAVLACKAGVLFELLSADVKKLLLLAIVAGVSERLIPDFIEKISDDGGRSKSP